MVGDPDVVMAAIGQAVVLVEEDGLPTDQAFAGWCHDWHQLRREDIDVAVCTAVLLMCRIGLKGVICSRRQSRPA